MGRALPTPSLFRPTPRVLIVDDMPAVRTVHVRWLHASGMEVLTAENGRLALETARRAAPDVIVTDIDMPVMNGLDLCRHLRADAATRNVGVVVVTGGANLQDAVDAGCDVALRKPCSSAVLLQAVQRLLGR
jgi:CheY-like chemotaxis protein